MAILVPSWGGGDFAPMEGGEAEGEDSSEPPPSSAVCIRSLIKGVSTPLALHRTWAGGAAGHTLQLFARI